MPLLDELKQKLFDMGVFTLDQGSTDRVYFYGHFESIDEWPKIDLYKDFYEDYQKNPYDDGDSPYDGIEPGLSIKEFVREFDDEEYTGELESLDCENFEVQSTEILGDRIVIKAVCGGDWQMPHNIEITYFGGDKFEVKDLGMADDFEEGKGSEDFCHLFGLKAHWE